MLKNPTSPENRFLYLTVWSFQVSKPDDLHLYAQQAKKAGFQGIGLIINWDRIQPERGKFDWTWLDECLDILVEEDVQLALGLMFWTGPLPWADELCVMQTAQGQPYVFDSQRGSTLCLNNPETLSVARDTIAAWAEHTSQRYGKRIVKYSTHFSVYGEVEYSPVGIALDFSPSEQAAFRAYMHARAGGLEAINRDYNLELADWAAFDAMPVTDLVAISRYDWMQFKTATLVNINRMVVSTVREYAPDTLVAMQVGSIWDEAAATARGTYDAYRISREVDMLHIDDAPGWPHDFSLDMTSSLTPGRLLAQELDGAQHKGALPDAYLRQAEMTGAAAVHTMNTANLSAGAFIEWRKRLFDFYPELFLHGAVRPAAPQERAILFNTADFITRQPSGAQSLVLESTYRSLSGEAGERVRFVSDSMILENPALLSELTEGLYLGDAGTMRFEVAVAEALASAECPIYADRAVPKISDPFGHALPGDLEERLVARIQVAP